MCYLLHKCSVYSFVLNKLFNLLTGFLYFGVVTCVTCGLLLLHLHISKIPVDLIGEWVLLGLYVYKTYIGVHMCINFITVLTCYLAMCETELQVDRKCLHCTLYCLSCPVLFCSAGWWFLHTLTEAIGRPSACIPRVCVLLCMMCRDHSFPQQIFPNSTTHRGKFTTYSN